MIAIIVIFTLIFCISFVPMARKVYKWKKLTKKFKPFIGMNGWWDLHYACFWALDKKTTLFNSSDVCCNIVYDGNTALRFIPCTIKGFKPEINDGKPILDLALRASNIEVEVKSCHGRLAIFKPNVYQLSQATLGEEVPKNQVVTFRLEMVEKRSVNQGHISYAFHLLVI